MDRRLDEHVLPLLLLLSLLLILLRFTLGIKDPEGFGKIIEHGRSGHYSGGQSSRMKESWSNTLLNRCTMMDRRRNIKSRLPLVARQLTDFFLLEDLGSHKPTHWSGQVFQQRLAENESRLSEWYICLSSWQSLVLLLILLPRQLRLYYYYYYYYYYFENWRYRHRGVFRYRYSEHLQYTSSSRRQKSIKQFSGGDA